METLKTYLTAVAADADSTAEVNFDLVDSVLDADGTETATDAADQYVLKLTAKDVTTAAEAEKLASYAYVVHPAFATFILHFTKLQEIQL